MVVFERAYGDNFTARFRCSRAPNSSTLYLCVPVFALITTLHMHRTSRKSGALAAHPVTAAAAVLKNVASTPGSEPGLHSGSVEGSRTADNHSGDCRGGKGRDGREDINVAHRSNPRGVNGGAGAVDGSILWWWLASVVCSFLASGVLHEAVAFIAMRRTFWPFNTLFLALSASMTPCWDMLFPVLLPPAGCTSTGKDVGNTTAMKPATEPVTVTVTATGPAALTLNVGESCAVPRVVPAPSIGRSRGWTAVVVYVFASVPLTLAVDYLVWQWWRHAVMEG